ncbi:methyltransferase [Amycolatopsis sp. PS_44_ISF1]|uniref:methyltransferase n=1 Tax=Amycolatopsis sp. PS_44_ISF1 TaxID=2974917 RepID=UPI0028DDAF9A|nr:methyltransferase [Amycolatopsis sp. PS_44_ISF1]MDT8913048.1 methyltransferase [Amycolatopsis sp. PS_44_ISF1]
MTSETTGTAALAALVDLATPFAVRSAVALKLPELVRDGCTTTDALAKASGTDPDALARLLRHLVAVGLFAEPVAGEHELTPVSEALLDERNALLRSWLDADGPGLKMDLAYSGMLHAVRTGTSAYGAVHGRDFWADYREDDRLRSFFGTTMAGFAWQTGPELAARHDWSAASSVLDVGGGTGALLAAVLGAHPHLRGAALDLPEVRPEAEEFLARLGGRAEFVGGSYFDPLPAGHDVVIVSRVLTDWPDADATRILRRCAEAVTGGGRVLVVEVLAGAEHAKNNSSFDLQSLTLLGGRERRPEDFDALAAAAGLVRLDRLEGANGLVVLEYARG